MTRGKQPARPRQSRAPARRFAAGAAVTVVLAVGAIWSWSSADDARGEPLTDVEARGRQLYQANCAACHGTKGEGQANWKSARADGTRPAPPHDPSGHTWHHPDAVLFGIVRAGGTYDAPPGYPATMPGFRGALTDVQIVEVLAYVKTMWGERERQYQSTMSQAGPFPSGLK